MCNTICENMFLGQLMYFFYSWIFLTARIITQFEIIICLTDVNIYENKTHKI